MQIIKSQDLENSWKDLIYGPKQLQSVSLDLTIKRIYHFLSQGALDFGGSEFNPSQKQVIDPRIEDDPKYGWWTLSEGSYLLEYNEVLSNLNYIAIVYPHSRLLITGCYHAPFVIPPSSESETIRGILIVGKMGVRIKENARVSTALTFSF
jgi:deoxycytidine triphosphate deaminase